MAKVNEAPARASKVQLVRQQNLSGDAKRAPQGFGKVSRVQPPAFDPRTEADEACAFFEAHGFAVLANCLDATELAHLNEFCDRTQAERPEAWGLEGRRKPHHRNQGLIYSQPLLDYPELDRYTRHPSSFPVVARLLGGEQAARFAEFNFRETPEGAGEGTMNFHHDAVVADRFTRIPYMPCDWLCAIHYLTDVEPGTPAFCVVPGSNRFETLKAAHKGLGKAYGEVPLYGKAGTCVLYDTATLPHPAGRRRPAHAPHLAPVLRPRRLAAQRAAGDRSLRAPAHAGADRLEPVPRAPCPVEGPGDAAVLLALEHGDGRVGGERVRPRGAQVDAARAPVARSQATGSAAVRRRGPQPSGD